MDKNAVITKVGQYKNLLQGTMAFNSIYLYGSYARDTSREDSDIDVAVIVDEPIDDYFQVVPLLWKLRRQIDDRIEPLLIDKNNDPAGFLDDIKAYGIEI